MALAKLPILEQLSALADATRSRLLLLLDRHELTVSELCTVLQLPQSTVSRHLKTLVDGHWVQSRREGTKRVYRLRMVEPSSSRSLWDLARAEVASTLAAREDARRLEGVLAARRRRSEEFFDAAGAAWDQLRDELFGQQIYGAGLLALVDDSWTLADLGCGSGPVAEALAPFVHRVIGIDDSRAMLDAAAKRLAPLDNVELRRGRLEGLPLDDESVDAATLVLVLHHVADPAAVLAEAARVLRPGSPLLVIDMQPHDRQEYCDQMGHVWMGFSSAQLDDLLVAAGLEPAGRVSLPAALEAKGPGLFAARAKKRARRPGSRIHRR